MIFMSFAVRLDFSGSAADAPGLALLTPHVHGYAGEGKHAYRISQKQQQQQPQLGLYHPASNLHSLNICGDLIHTGKIMIWDTLLSPGQ